MVDPRTAERLSFLGLYFVLVAVVLFAGLLPLSLAPRTWMLPASVLDEMPDWFVTTIWPGPDVLLCLTVLWVQRRPGFLPAWLIAVVFLLDDILTMRPPGLWALIVLAGTEFLRRREIGLRDLPFWGEFGMAAAAILVMMFSYWLALSIFLVPTVGPATVLVRALSTIALYPLLAALIQGLFGLRRAATGEVDQLGKRR